jgi:hypothetical protein
MRRYVVLLLVCVVEGCTPLRVAPGGTLVTGIDFSPYTKQGFFFSTEMFPGTYEPVGLVTVTTIPPAHQEHDEIGYVVWRIQPVLLKDVVDTMYQRAKSMGADALVNFRVRTYQDRIDLQTTRDAVELSGFAIRRRAGR